MRNFLILFCCIALLASCKEPEARRPKKHSTTSFYQELIENNKKMVALETRQIERFLAKDSLITYTTSQNGFWYYYNTKDSTNTQLPKLGDVVEFEYNIKTMGDLELYPKEKRLYKVDKESFIPALQDGIKLMKQGETITFVIPSYRGFGVTGDGDKINGSQPIKSTVTLIKIIKQHEN